MTLATLPVEAAAALVTYRWSVDTDGPAIGALFAAADYGDLGVDWTIAHVAHGWFLAERAGVLLGAIQVFMGQPFAVIGDCVVRPEARARGQEGTGTFGKPGRVTLTLYAMVLNALTHAGAQVALGMTKKPGMARILGRYGAVPLGTYEGYAKGLR